MKRPTSSGSIEPEAATPQDFVEDVRGRIARRCAEPVRTTCAVCVAVSVAPLALGLRLCQTVAVSPLYGSRHLRRPPPHHSDSRQRRVRKKAPLPTAKQTKSFRRIWIIEPLSGSISRATPHNARRDLFPNPRFCMIRLHLRSYGLVSL